MSGIDAVIDPTLPARDRELLEADPSVLHAAERPPKARFGGRTARDLLFCAWHTPLWAHLPGVTGLFFSTRIKVLGFVAQAVVLGLFVVMRGDALFVIAAAEPFVFLALLAQCGEGRAGRLAREHHGRYVVPSTLGDESYRLLGRTQKAIDAVLGSVVNREGLLDDVRNAVTLPYQEWEIAQTLAQLSKLRSEHLQAKHRGDPEVAAILGPQRKALELVTASVTERIVALEKYADRTRAADLALDQWNTVQRLSSHTDAYQELLARTVRDELALAEIDGLTEQAKQVEEALRASVEKARRAGLALVPDRKAA